jgi:hypothetical protein
MNGRTAIEKEDIGISCLASDADECLMSFLAVFAVRRKALMKVTRAHHIHR